MKAADRFLRLSAALQLIIEYPKGILYIIFSEVFEGQNIMW